MITKVRNKYVVTALREVAHGLVQFENAESHGDQDEGLEGDNIH